MVARMVNRNWLSPTRAGSVAALSAWLTMTPHPAQAQQPGGGEAPAAPAGAGPSTSAETPGGGNVTIMTLPAAPAQSTSGSEAPDINAHLPSSSRVSTDTSRSADGFDFEPGGGSGGTVRGGAKGSYVVSGQYVPDVHTAKRGDTLWDISGKYYGNPYQWPRVWSYNQQIQNPHWIYPGDHIRLRGDYGVRPSQVGLGRPLPDVRPDTVYVPYVGYIEDGQDPKWGELVGSPDDQMILSYGDLVYIQLDEKYHASVGQQLLVIEPMDVENLAGAEFVYVRGVVQVNRYNPKTHMVRALITGSLRPIERGCRVAPLDILIDRVSPVRNKKTIRARIVGSLDPFVYYGADQVVFIDKGRTHGVEVGNRFFAVWRGDRWEQGLKTAGRMGDWRAITEDNRWARVEETPLNGIEERYPAETYAELIVVRVRDETAVCLVSASTREIPRGAELVAHQGY